MTFFADTFSDAVLLRIGHAFEKASSTRGKGPQPFHPPKTELDDVKQMPKE